MIALGAIYEVGMVAWKGGTVGKLILGLRVVNQSDHRYPPTAQAAGLRWLPTLLTYFGIIGSLLGLIIFVLSLVWLFSDTHRRTVYDRVASTYVVKV